MSTFANHIIKMGQYGLKKKPDYSDTKILLATKDN